MKTQSISKLFVDMTLFAGFLLAFFLDLTGLELHQWLGIGLAALAGYHLLSHWSWVEVVSERFFGKTSAQARVYYVLDEALLVGFLVIAATGLVISSWLDLTLSNAGAWINLHILASIATLLLVAVKLGLHWRWIAAKCKEVLDLAAPARQAVPASAPCPVSRREFLQVMGVVGVSSAIALGGALEALQGTQAAAGEGEASSEASSETAEITQVQPGSSSLACQVQCGKRCSYPGHCRRYTDTNGNNRCDWGECA